SCIEEHGNLRPTLEDLHAQIVSLPMLIKRRSQITLPPAREIGRLHQPQFLHQWKPPEMLIEESIESAVEKHTGGSIHPPGHREMDVSKKVRRHPCKGNRQTREEERNDSLFVGICTVSVHTAPARLPKPNKPCGLLIAHPPSCC